MKEDLHAHDPTDALETHATGHTSPRALSWAVALTLTFAAVEFHFGIVSESIALVADAGHMLTDSLALFLALSAQIISRRPPTGRSSYGHGRIEALAAFVNGLIMLGIVVWIASEAMGRFFSPRQVMGELVMVVAAIGLVINVVIAGVLSRDASNLNTRAALVHVMGDLLGSVAALLSGAIIYLTNWFPIDPLLSLFVCGLILRSTIRILRMSYRILMEHVPEQVDFYRVGAELSAMPGVTRVHNLHIWELRPGHIALTGHVELEDIGSWPSLLEDMIRMLRDQHGIDHVTLQPESPVQRGSLRY